MIDPATLRKMGALCDVIYNVDDAEWTFDRGGECWQLEGQINIDLDEIEGILAARGLIRRTPSIPRASNVSSSS